MAGYGWTYLLFTHELAGSEWKGSDGSAYTTETEMFYELGITGWELVGLLPSSDHVVYYFKRPRS